MLKQLSGVIYIPFTVLCKNQKKKMTIYAS